MVDGVQTVYDAVVVHPGCVCRELSVTLCGYNSMIEQAVAGYYARASTSGRSFVEALSVPSAEVGDDVSQGFGSYRIWFPSIPYCPYFSRVPYRNAVYFHCVSHRFG